MDLWRVVLLLVAAAAAASLASCKGGDSPFAAGGAQHPGNTADAAFLRSMAAHDKGALPITQLAQHRARRVELRRIARTMTGEQTDDLRGFGRLGQPAAAAPRSAAGDLGRVKAATSFDYEFMRTMIEQNEAAIAIARREIASGTDAALKRLAVAIGASRQKELEQLRAWLHLWYGEVQPAPAPPEPPPVPSAPPEASPQV